MRKPSPRRAFTMIELLTVIGIIIVLMAILLPVVSRVRVQSQIAATQSQINMVCGAIERYLADQGSYPGPISNAIFTSTGGNVLGFGTGADGLTMTENMVAGLCGGIEYDQATIRKAKVDVARVGTGAILHVADRTRASRLQVYIDPTPGSMMPLQPWGTGAAALKGKQGRAGTAGDCAIPEFVDRFQHGDLYPEGRALVYLRANVGNTGIATADNTTQYNTNMFNPYLGRKPGVNNQGVAYIPGDFDATTPEPGSQPAAPAFTNFNNYLKHPTLPGVPRNRDQYILVSAGADGIFGSKDDIFNSGNQ